MRISPIAFSDGNYFGYCLHCSACASGAQWYTTAPRKYGIYYRYVTWICRVQRMRAGCGHVTGTKKLPSALHCGMLVRRNEVVAWTLAKDCVYQRLYLGRLEGVGHMYLLPHCRVPTGRADESQSLGVESTMRTNPFMPIRTWRLNRQTP